MARTNGAGLSGEDAAMAEAQNSSAGGTCGELWPRVMTWGRMREWRRGSAASARRVTRGGYIEPQPLVSGL